MATKSRTIANTVFGADVAVLTLGSNSDAYKYLTDASLTISTPSTTAKSIVDFDTAAKAGPSSVTMSCSGIIVSDGVPMIASALGETDAGFSAVIRHATGGTQYQNNVTTPYTGYWLFTSAKLTAGDGAVTESLEAVLQGELKESHGAAATIAARTDYDQTLYPQQLTSLAIGSDDFINLYDSFDIDVSFGTTVGSAVLDGWQWPVSTGRERITVNASRVVENASSAASLFWLELARARAAVTVTIPINSLVFTGSFIVEDAKWSSGGSGAQKETITLRNNGVVTMTEGT